MQNLETQTPLGPNQCQFDPFVFRPHPQSTLTLYAVIQMAHGC